MIRIEKEEIYGFEAAIRGMRNSFNSWDKSDSLFFDQWSGEAHDICGNSGPYDSDRVSDDYSIGMNDIELMRRLAHAGSSHAKFRRMIMVSIDITAPLYWWPEFDTYKVGTVRNSCSKMHKLLNKSFDVSDFSFDHLPGYRNEVIPFTPEVTEEMARVELWRPTYVSPTYEVSNFGRARVRTKNGYRMIFGSKHADGYIFLTINGKQFPKHRLIGMAFLKDSYQDGLIINHKDGNKQNNFVDNLEWVTQKENILHSINNRLQPVHTKTYMGKFSDEDRQAIKDLWESGDMSKREIAKLYNVSHTCINDIINDRYKYIEQENIFKGLAIPIVDTLNELRDLYFRTHDSQLKKRIWMTILELLPQSYNQKSTVLLNYEVLSHIYSDRKNHKLDEWREFCTWIEKLPFAEGIIFPMEGNE